MRISIVTAHLSAAGTAFTLFKTARSREKAVTPPACRKCQKSALFGLARKAENL